MIRPLGPASIAGGALARTGWCEPLRSSEPPNERGVGVPSSRSLATATREAKSVYEWRRVGRDSSLVSMRGPTTPRARMTHADAHSIGGPCAMLSRALICTRQAPWPSYSTWTPRRCCCSAACDQTARAEPKLLTSRVSSMGRKQVITWPDS